MQLRLVLMDQSLCQGQQTVMQERGEVSSGKLIHVYEVFSSSITAICFKPTRFNTKSFFAGQPRESSNACRYR